MKNKAGMHKVVATDKFIWKHGKTLDDSSTRKAPKASTLARRSKIAAREAAKAKPAPVVTLADVSTVNAQTDVVEIDTTTAQVSETTTPAEATEQASA